MGNPWILCSDGWDYLVLYMENEKPKTAKALLIGAIIGFIVSALIYAFSPSILKTLFSFMMKLNR